MQILWLLSTSIVVPFRMVLAADHLTPYIGAVPTVTRSRNGSAFGSSTGAVTSIGNGWYHWLPSASDLTNLGPWVVRAVAATADDAYTQIQVVAFNPDTSTNLGLSSLPTAGAGNANGLITRGTGANQFNPLAGKVDLTPGSLAAILTDTVLAEAYPADGAPATLAQLLYLLLANLSQFDLVATSLVARKLDGTTPAATYLLDDAVNPTSRTRSG